MRASASIWPPALLLLTTCSTGNGPVEGSHEAPRDTTWEAEYRPGPDRVMLCGSGARYRVAGPGLYQLREKYAAAFTTPGSPVKVWVEGHLGLAGVMDDAPADSALIVTAVLHVDATLRCPPVPVAASSGRYEIDLPGESGTQRHVAIELFDNGDALMTTTMDHDGTMLEEDGTWGVNSMDQVQVDWPKRQQRMLFRVNGDRLVNDMPGVNAEVIVLRRVGQADRLSGTFGTLAAHLAAWSVRSPDPAALRPGTPLSDLYPDSASMRVMLDSLRSTYGFSREQVQRDLAAAGTIGDLAHLIRAQQRR